LLIKEQRVYVGNKINSEKLQNKKSLFYKKVEETNGLMFIEHLLSAWRCVMLHAHYRV